MQLLSARRLTRLPRFAAARLAAPACLALGACTADDLSIGSGQPGPGGKENPNCEDGILRQNAFLRRQADVNALAGCREIQGSLYIYSFPDMDLRPLGALRRVTDRLSIRADVDDLALDAPLDGLPDPAIYLQGHLPALSHLEGFGSLEQVGSLSLFALSVPDLSAFSHLSAVGSHPRDHLQPGAITISDCNALTDLSGLEELVDWERLSIVNDLQLQSLNGLQAFFDHDTLTLSNLPQLTDLSALQILGLEELHLEKTGVENLAGLQRLEANVIQISENPALVQINDLQVLARAQSVEIVDNPLLEDFPPLGFAPDNLVVTGNARLRSVLSGATAHIRERYEIADNPQLVEVGLPWFQNTDPAVCIRDLSVHDNASLTRLDLGSCQKFDILSIENNPALNDLEGTGLQSVDELHVANNPQLSTASFAQVKTFKSEMSGNLDGPAL
jgi:hypothetical protein